MLPRPISPPSPTPYSINRRLEASSNEWFITDLTVQLPSSSSSSSNSAQQQSKPSRWRSKEFCLYYAVFILVVPKMAWIAVNLSRETHPNYQHYQHRLSNGWLFGWKVDTSDYQYNSFRSRIPLLLLLGVLWLSLHRFFLGSSPLSTTTPSISSSTPIPSQVHRRTRFTLALSLLLLLLLHGTSLPKLLLILYLNYTLTYTLTTSSIPFLRNSSPFLSWVFNLTILFSNEIFEGYRYAELFPFLPGTLMRWLDEGWRRGLVPRWHIGWNITMLRLVSFDMDFWWSRVGGNAYSPSTVGSGSTGTEEMVGRGDESAGNGESFSSGGGGLGPATANGGNEKSQPSPTERSRIITSHPPQLYSFPLYLLYSLYFPLYLTGPIITYNSFISQLHSPPTITRRTLLSYALRWVACVLTLEFVLHTMYVVAIKEESRRGAWKGDSPAELSMIGFWNLIVVWLKLLVPWRFFRLWSLLDGIDPPENMVRCMANNYSTSGFWRSWHRSYNLWVVRYLYIPIGGSTHAALGTLVVFTFVALWHDLSLKLLTWGWVISLFVLPEMGARKVWRADKYGHQPYYRHLCAIGGVLNVLMMMTANLIGFAIGTEGMRYMWGEIVGSWEGIKFIVFAIGCLFVAVQVMFEYREEERRRGIVRRF
ncbi:MBOAT-domain-containing protein [Meredithblackwellia eburnea MCA 4105]